MKVNLINLFMEFIFIISLVIFFIFPYKPVGVLDSTDGSEVSMIMPIYIWICMLFLTFCVYVRFKADIVSKSLDDKEVYMYTKADEKKPFRKASYFYLFAFLFFFYWEITGIIFSIYYLLDIVKLEDAPYQIITFEMQVRLFSILGVLLVGFIANRLNFVYRQNYAFWKLELEKSVVHYDDALNILGKTDIKKKSIKESIKFIFMILRLDRNTCRNVEEEELKKEQLEIAERIRRKEEVYKMQAENHEKLKTQLRESYYQEGNK